MTIAWKWGYVQEVLYAGYAGAITGDVKWRKRRYDDRLNAVSGSFAESKFLRLRVSVGFCLFLIQPVFGQPEMLEPPGRLIEVNGHRLHLNCTGEGRPTVVYEAAAGGSSLDWEKVQPVVAATTRSCSYDRAGLGWSEPSDADKTTSQDIAEELHELLRKAGEKAPYIMVSHSIGGFYLQMFAHLYPDEVAGAVLVDSSHKDQFDWYQKYAKASQNEPPTKTSERPSDEPSRTPETEKIVRAMNEDPKIAATEKREGAGIVDSVTLLRKFDSLPNIPLIVLTKSAERQLEDHWTTFDLMWNQAQRDLTTLSPRSTQIYVPGAGHYIHQARPDVVIASILRIVAIARKSDRVLRE